MNIALFGYILAWLGVIYVILSAIATFNEYRKLPSRLQEAATINFNVPLAIFAISVVYIIVYHIS